MHKSISKVLLISVVLSIFSITTFAASSFKDVPETHWAYNSIMDMQKRGIMLVNSNGEFLPNNKITYFEMMEILAKATNYDANNDAVIQNYAKQKPMLAQYAQQYGKAWDMRYNDKIAYLYGKGYITKADIDKMLVKDGSGAYVKAVITKQDLCVYLVRVLQKQETAKKEYVTTGFADEVLIKEENRPNVAYLKKIGLVSGDANNMLGANTEVTRALASKMISDCLAYKEKGSVSNQTNTSVTTSTNTLPGSIDATLKKLINKNDTEYYVLLDKGNGNTSFYTMQKTIAITDINGQIISPENIKLDSKVKAVIEAKSAADYITKMIVVEGGSTAVTIPSTTPTTVTPSYILIQGTVDRVGINGDISILTNDLGVQTYMLADNCTVVIDGVNGSIYNVSVDSQVRGYLQGEKLIRLDITTTGVLGAQGSTNALGTSASGVLVEKSTNRSNYIFVLENVGKRTSVTVPIDAEMTRNSKTTDFYGIKVGDTVQVVRNSSSNLGKVNVIATGTETKVQGTLKEIIISAAPKVTVETEKGMETFAVTATTDIYDSVNREDISLRNLRIGQQVQLLLDSKEAISLVVQKDAPSVRYKGTIESFGKGNKYLEVLVEYEPLNGQSMIIKRVNISVDVEIFIDGRREHVSDLRVGDEVLISYDYLDDMCPSKITLVD